MAVSDNKQERSVSHVRLIIGHAHALAFSHYMVRYLTLWSLFHTEVSSPSAETQSWSRYDLQWQGLQGLLLQTESLSQL